MALCCVLCALRAVPCKIAALLLVYAISSRPSSLLWLTYIHPCAMWGVVISFSIHSSSFSFNVVLDVGWHDYAVRESKLWRGGFALPHIPFLFFIFLKVCCPHAIVMRDTILLLVVSLPSMVLLLASDDVLVVLCSHLCYAEKWTPTSLFCCSPMLFFVY